MVFNGSVTIGDVELCSCSRERGFLGGGGVHFKHNQKFHNNTSISKYKKANEECFHRKIDQCDILASCLNFLRTHLGTCDQGTFVVKILADAQEMQLIQDKAIVSYNVVKFTSV